MVYFLPDWSRTTSTRMLIAESAFDGAGPYLRFIGHELDGHTMMMDDWGNTQDGDAQDGYLCAFDAEHSDLGITLCDAILVQRVRLC